MNKNLQNVYNIIPPDYLHYIEGEDHRCLLSEQELEKIVEYCVEHEFSYDDIINIVRKFELARVAHITTERFFNDELDIKKLDENGDISWSPKYAS